MMSPDRLLFLLGLLSAVPAGGQDWTVVPLGTTDDILMVENTSNSEKWIVGQNGYAAQSSAGRTAWTQFDVGTSADLLSVKQPSLGQVWVGAGAGSLRVKSGGDWLVRDIPEDTEDFSLFTRSSGAMWAVGTGGSIYRSTDVGQTWSLSWSAGVALHDGNGFINGPAYAVGDGGTILKTTDAGANWAALPSGTGANLYGFLEGGQATGLLAVGEAGTIIHSLDSGATWSDLASGTSATLFDVSSSKQNSSWLIAVGEGGTVLKSTDGGQSWCHLDAGTEAELYGVEAVTNSEYIVGGAGGLLLRTTTGGGDCITVAVEDEPPGGRRLILAGPHPNPLRSAASFTLQVPRDQRVIVDLFDLSGRRIANLFSGSVRLGERVTIPMEARGLASGAYCARVTAGGEVTTRRVIVAH